MPSFRILIVEDQREVSRLLRSALETLEYKMSVIEIPSGEEAILYSSRNPVDLLVSDYRLPGMTGTELMRKVRKYHPEMKVILITGQTDPKVRREVAEAGADAFFIKPVPIADFLDSVERHLGLVETILPPEPIAVEDEDEIQRNLPDLLAHLRQELEAIAVLLLGDSGRVLARAGDLPDSNDEISLLSSLLSIHSAGQKVSRLIGQKVPSNWYVFDGGKYDLIFAPVGMTHAMLVIGKNLAKEDRVLKTVDIFAAARKIIESALGEVDSGTPATQEPPTTPLEVVEQSAREMDPLFKEAKKKLKSADVNEFWDKAADKHKAPTKPDMLSYDQAKQLGLTPEDET
jgi:CheY-like chemotaxis protein